MIKPPTDPGGRLSYVGTCLRSVCRQTRKACMPSLRGAVGHGYIRAGSGETTTKDVQRFALITPQSASLTAPLQGALLREAYANRYNDLGLLHDLQQPLYYIIFSLLRFGGSVRGAVLPVPDGYPYPQHFYPAVPFVPLLQSAQTGLCRSPRPIQRW